MDATGQGPTVEDEMAALLRALAHPARVALVAELAGGEASTGALAAATGEDPAELGRHLAALEAAGAVLASAGHGGARYRLADPELGAACASLRGVLTGRVATARRLDEFVMPGPRPDRRA